MWSKEKEKNNIKYVNIWQRNQMPFETWIFDYIPELRTTMSNVQTNRQNKYEKSKEKWFFMFGFKCFLENWVNIKWRISNEFWMNWKFYLLFSECFTCNTNRAVYVLNISKSICYLFCALKLGQKMILSLISRQMKHSFLKTLKSNQYLRSAPVVWHTVLPNVCHVLT